MPIDERTRPTPPLKLHTLSLQNREKLSVSGVDDVDSFDENTVIIKTAMGVLTIKGNSLHISQLNVETKDVNLEGHIDSLVYTCDTHTQKKGFLSGIFK